MTYEEIKRSNAEFLNATDISPILHCDPQALRVQAHTAPERLGFAVVIIGQRCRFPRRAFLSFLDEQTETR